MITTRTFRGLVIINEAKEVCVEKIRLATNQLPRGTCTSSNNAISHKKWAVTVILNSLDKKLF